jgi:hypothetical protein
LALAISEVTRAAKTARTLAARSAAGVTVGALAAALGLFLPTQVLAQAQTQTAQVQAQTQASGLSGGLLQPSLQGNPSTPPRFRRPGQGTNPLGNETPPVGTFTASSSMIGSRPVYGSPNGFGAGNTGFDSTNILRRKRRPRALTGNATTTNETFAPAPSAAGARPPLAITPPPPPVIYPKKAAGRVGATLPEPPLDTPLSNPPGEIHPLTAALRTGADLPIPPAERFDYTASTPPPTLPPINTFPLGVLPQQQLPIGAVDPWAPLGVRAGSFLLLPSIDLSAGYNTSPERSFGTPPSAYFVAAPELQVASDWERHSLTADIAGSYTWYASDALIPSLNAPYLNSKIDGRVDVTRDTQILLENRVIVSTDNPGSPNLQAQLAKLPPNQDVGETLGLVESFNRLTFTLKGTFDRATYNESVLTDGTTSSNDDRNFDQYGGSLRIGYEIDPGLKPFIEVAADTRVHDEQFDSNGLERDSVGASVKVGSAVNLFGTLSGEMAVGYMQRDYQDPTLPNIGGVIGDGSLIWQATPLTTAKLTATSQIYETTLDGASGEFSRDIALQVDHAFLTWLIGTWKAGYGNDNYTGSGLTDNRYFTSIGLTYKFSREWQIRTELREDWQTASQPGFSYTGTTVLFGVRAQR